MQLEKKIKKILRPYDAEPLIDNLAALVREREEKAYLNGYYSGAPKSEYCSVCGNCQKIDPIKRMLNKERTDE